MYEGLFAVNESFEAVPVLCTGWTVSENGLVWTFTLDGSARFSDGTPLAAGDAAASLNLARGSPLYAARLAGITAVTAGAGTVAITLSAPNTGLPLLLDVPVFRESGDPDRPLGTGPYVLEGEGDSLTLRCWRGGMPVASIPLLAVNEAGDLIYAFETRDISLVSTDFTGSNALGFSGSFETQDYATSVLLYLGFNAARGLCREEGLRLALQRALDRETVSSVLLARHADPAALPVSPACALYDRDLAGTLAYDPAAAAQALEDLGWTPGPEGVRTRGRETLALDLVVSSDNTGRLAVAEALAAGLEELGVAVTLRSLPWEAYVSALERGDFDLYLAEVQMTADFDLTPFVTAGGSLNYGGYTGGETAALLAAFRAAGAEERPAAARALYSQLAAHPAFVPLCFKRWSVLSQWGQVEGLTPTQQNLFYGFSGWRLRTAEAAGP